MLARDRVANRAVFERYLTATEERQLFSHIAKFGGVLAQRDHAWMMLLRQTGIRVGTLAALNVGDAQVALQNGELVVRPEAAKRGLGYRVPVTKTAREALQALLRVRRKMGFAPVPDEPLVVSQRKQRMSIRSYQARMQQWVRDAGLAIDASPHWFRHTLAQRIIERTTASDPLGMVQGALGHRSRNSAAIYSLPSREQIAQAVEDAR